MVECTKRSALHLNKLWITVRTDKERSIEQVAISMHTIAESILKTDSRNTKFNIFEEISLSPLRNVKLHNLINR